MLKRLVIKGFALFFIGISLTTSYAEAGSCRRFLEDIGWLKIKKPDPLVVTLSQIGVSNFAEDLKSEPPPLHPAQVYQGDPLLLLKGGPTFALKISDAYRPRQNDIGNPKIPLTTDSNGNPIPELSTAPSRFASIWSDPGLYFADPSYILTDAPTMRSGAEYLHLQSPEKAPFLRITKDGTITLQANERSVPRVVGEYRRYRLKLQEGQYAIGDEDINGYSGIQWNSGVKVSLEQSKLASNALPEASGLTLVIAFEGESYRFSLEYIVDSKSNLIRGPRWAGREIPPPMTD